MTKQMIPGQTVTWKDSAGRQWHGRVITPIPGGMTKILFDCNGSIRPIHIVTKNLTLSDKELDFS